MSEAPEAIAATIQKSNPINLAICAVVIVLLAGCYSLLKANEGAVFLRQSIDALIVKIDVNETKVNQGADRLGQRLDALTSKIEAFTVRIERCAPAQLSAIGHDPRRSEHDALELPPAAPRQTKTAASESSPYPQCRIPAGTL